MKWIVLTLVIFSYTSYSQHCYDPCDQMVSKISGANYGLLSYEEMLTLSDSIVSRTSECPDCIYFSYFFWEWAAHQFRYAKNHIDQRKSLLMLDEVFHKILWDEGEEENLDKYCTLKMRWGHYAIGIGDLTTAKQKYSSIIDTIKRSGLYSEGLNTTKNICNQRLSDIARTVGDLNEAERYLTYAIEDELQYAKSKKRDPIVWSIYSKRGQIKYLNEKYSSAFEDHLKTFSYIENYLDTVSRERLVSRSMKPIFDRLVYLGKTALKLDKEDYYQKCINYLEELPLLEHDISLLSLDLLKMEEAMMSSDLDIATTIGKTVLTRLDTLPNEIELSLETLTSLGEAHILKKDYKNANDFFNKGISAIELSPLSEKYNNEYLTLNKNKLLVSKLQSNENESAKIIKKMLLYIDKRLEQNLYQSDHFKALGQILPILETGLEIAEENKDYSLMFDIIEYVKARKLENRYTTASDISDGRSAHINRYKAANSTLQNLKVAQLKGDTTLKTKNAIFETNRLCKNLKEKISTKKNRQHARTNIGAVQKNTNGNSIYISGFSGSKYYYILMVWHNKVELTRIDSEKLTSNANLFFQEISNPTSVEKAQELGKSLYSLIFNESFSGFDIVFALDDVLLTLPLEAIYDGDSYLVENNNIRYVPSAAMDQNWKYVNVRDIAVFKPSQQDGEVTLVAVDDELKAIQENFKVKIFSDQNATIKSFQNKISNYQVIHLATHAQSDTSDHSRAYINFTADESNDGKLYFDQLAALDLDAELVSLSACKTGVGKVVRSEGTQSLASQVLATGAQSVLSSLWSINDFSSSIILGTFYENLSSGVSKEEALGDAKRNYLKSAFDSERHPHYWSGIILTGSGQAIVKPLSYWHYTIGTIFLASIITVLLFYFKRRK